MLLANALEQNHPPSIACFHSGWPAWHAEREPAAGRAVAGRWPVRVAGRCRPAAGKQKLYIMISLKCSRDHDTI